MVLSFAALAAGDIVFVAHGDWGDSGSSGQQRQEYVAAIMDQWCADQDDGCDFVMALGDNFYPDGAESVDDDRFNYNWRDKYTGENIADLDWYITVGNHDHHNDNEIYQLQFGENEDRWVFPWYYWDTTIEDSDTSALFYAMDSEALRQGKHDPSAQMSDMEEKLSESTADWKIVYGHHPPLSVGRRWGDTTIYRDVVPLCEEYDVDALIAGHDHNLQHIVKTDNIDVEYIVSGGGGRSLYDYDADNEDTINDLGYHPEFFAATWGFVGVRLTASTMSVDYFDYTLSGGNANIREIYSFTRSKV